jgi:5-methylcytosine-specific restriction endonuclease McrA
MQHSLVLVLNASYEPLQLVRLERAIKLVYLAKAEIVEAASETVRSWLTEVARPSVIRLLRYVKLPHRPAPCTRRGILLRDGYTCQYCGAQPGTHLLTLDHVIPRTQGGQTVWENLVTACRACNHTKGGRTPQAAHMILRSIPRQPSWLSILMTTLERHPSWQAYAYQ